MPLDKGTPGVITVVNNTFVGNTATSSGGGVSITLDNTTSKSNLYNNILWSNTSNYYGDDIIICDDCSEASTAGEVNLYNNDFSDFYSTCQNQTGCTPKTNQGSNKNQNPLFVNITDPDPNHWDVHLTSNSPCIDAGNGNAPNLPSTDFHGDARTLGSAPDMGGYESPSQYTLAVIVTGSGTVTKNPNKSTYNDGEQVTLMATPNSGYSFSSWSGDAGGSTNPLNVTMSGNKNITANFTQNPPTQFTLTVNVTGSGTVTKNPNKSTYNDGEQVTLTATPAAGYSFSNWSGDLSSTTNPTTITINGTKNVTANFIYSPPITLQSPFDGTHFAACSLYSLPFFSWTIGETYKGYEIQFSPDSGFGSIPVKIKTPSTQVTMTSINWKKIMMISGGGGGTVYWRVVGTRNNKPIFTSEVRSIFIEPPQPVGGPTISPMSKGSTPELFWQNNCNIKFKISFGNDTIFIKKTSYSFNIKNPNDNGGIFTKVLTSGQWKAIRKLVGDVSGSTIYWYVESWDGLGRYNKTEVMDFVLTD